MNVFDEVRDVLREAAEIEHAELMHWRTVKPDSRTLPWMPFQISEFVAFMTDAVAASHGPRFLEVGCGPGSKLMLAETLFGLDGLGIEIDPDMTNQAVQMGVKALCADALYYRRYHQADIIWLYRPFRDAEAEAELEMKIRAKMKPGAVLVGAALELDPPVKWEVVVDDWELRRGAWKKPLR
jgi:SAM-dependent methyltransferase